MAENGGGGSNLSAEAQEAARRATAAARGMARDVEERLEGMRDHADDAGEWIRTMARERPVATLAVAAAVGFVVGRLLSRA